jgi:hypothetical protein
MLLFVAAAAAADTIENTTNLQQDILNRTAPVVIMAAKGNTPENSSAGGQNVGLLGMGLIAVAIVAIVAVLVVKQVRRRRQSNNQPQGYTVDFPVYGRVFVDDTDYPFSTSGLANMKRADDDDDIFTDEEDDDSFNPDRFTIASVYGQNQGSQSQGGLMEPFLIGDLENQPYRPEGRERSCTVPDAFDYSHISI